MNCVHNKKSVYFNDDANLFWGVIEHFRHSDDNSLCIDIGTYYGSYAERYVSLFENVVCFEANHYIEEKLRNKYVKGVLFDEYLRLAKQNKT